MDEGPGLGSAALDVLVGRADRLPRQAATGSGLGLWMVRRLVDEMSGGIVSVADREPAGTIDPRHHPVLAPGGARQCRLKAAPSPSSKTT